MRSRTVRREKVAELVHVNPHYISDAKRIKEASPELAEQVRDGRTSLPDAKKALSEQRQQTTGTEGRVEGATRNKPSALGRSSGQRKGEQLVLKSTTKDAAVAAKLVKFYGQPRAATILAALTDLVVSSTGEGK